MKKKFDTSKHGAAKAGVNLSDEAAGRTDGLTKYPKIKRSDQYCPRCGQKRVNRPLRRCDNCQGRLLWTFDDAKQFDETFTHYFRWYTFMNGLTGWTDADYWKGGFDK